MKLPVYKHLLDINAGFDQVVRALAALRKNDAFLAKELDRFSLLAKAPVSEQIAFLGEFVRTHPKIVKSSGWF